MDRESTTQVPRGRVSSEWQIYVAAAWIAVAFWIVVSLALGIRWLLDEPGSIPEEGHAPLITAVFYMSWSVGGLVAFGIGVILGMRWARLAGRRSWLLVIAASVILALVVSVLQYSIGHRFPIGYGVYIGSVVSLVFVLRRSRRPTLEDSSFPVSGQSPSPSPDLIGVGGRVELPEHGIAVTFPDGWIWVDTTGQDSGSIVDRVADLKGREFATLTRWLFEDLIPEVPVIATPGADQWCNLMVYPTYLTLDQMAANDRQAFRDAADADFGQPGSDLTVPSVTVTDVSLPAGPAYRTDWALAGTTDRLLETSDYTLKRGGTAVVLTCAMYGERPPDHWLSIAETIEFVAGGSRAGRQRQATPPFPVRSTLRSVNDSPGTTPYRRRWLNPFRALQRAQRTPGCAGSSSPPRTRGRRCQHPVGSPGQRPAQRRRGLGSCGLVTGSPSRSGRSPLAARTFGA